MKTQRPDKSNTSAQTTENTDIWHILENLPEDGKFKIRVEREQPLEVNGVDVSGIVAEYEAPVDSRSVKDKVGGGKYKIQVWKDGAYYAGRRVSFPGAPRLEKGSMAESTDEPARSHDGLTRTPPGPYRRDPYMYQDPYAELRAELKELRESIRNNNGNGNGNKQINPLDSLNSLSGFITTLMTAVTGGVNDPKRMIENIAHSFQQGLNVGQSGKSEAPSTETAAVIEAIKGAPELMKQWREIELEKLKLLLEHGYTPVNKNDLKQPAKTNPPKKPVDQDPNAAMKRILRKLNYAAQTQDDATYWAAYLTREVHEETLKELAEADEKKALEFFKAIDPAFVDVLIKYRDWFTQLISELRELMKEVADGTSSAPSDPPADPPGGPRRPDNSQQGS